MAKNAQGIIPLSIRLFKMAAPVKGMLTLSTVSSILSNLSHIGLMSFGALLILHCGGYAGGSVTLWGGLVLLCSVSIALNRYIEGVVSHAGAYSLLCDMRVKMYETLRQLAPACLMDRQKGDILSVAVADIETIEVFFAHTIGPLFTVILLPLVTLSIAWRNHPLFVAVLLPIYLIISIVLPLLAIRAGRKIGMEYRTAVGRLKSLTLESVYGLKDIQIFGAGQAKLDKVKAQTSHINRVARLMTLHRQIVTSTPTFFIYLARIAVVSVAAHLAASGQSDPAGVIVLSYVVSASFSSSQSLTAVISSLLETYAAAVRVFTIEDMVPEVKEAPLAVEIKSIEKIDFRNVSFAYARDRKAILDEMNLTLQRGDSLGVVGESGIGKSTVIRLLLRFWDVTGGEIRINDIPLKKIKLSSLRNRIAMLEQDTFIFDDTIAANIALGRPDAPRKVIVAAAKQAGIHDFIETLADGYETQMGELGGRLSGGEKQRIGIARTLLMNPDMLVMDEPTSNLDILSEKALLRTLDKIGGAKTIMIVSHRSSTLNGCGRITTLKEGKAV